ncbi:TIGR02391 family protein [Arthrobacter sp. NEB 688]|uniref:TIGR02391 family protein n=1 Tax=Arthrobacter sp. NEB 688 TaxID=904039 RepID=UPI0015649E79|nr:TIGR02391 family protein [Arthrobacter sp. NEB 688]QKE84649.1 TIGR02391 family protein [Arthrobacter sp. NEB 688]
MQEWTLESDAIIGLPIDDLAMRVLDDAKANGEWNWRNWLLSAQQTYGKNSQAMLALTEAWAWLANRGLIVADVNQSAEQAFLISRAGHQALEEGLPWLRAVQRLDVELVMELEARARPQFLRGDFEAAAFIAMKEVEVRVRELSGLPNELVGVDLMRQAFRPGREGKEGGPLWKEEGHAGEAVAVMELFAGALGLFKNPASHRRVDFSDPTEAAEVVLLADLLLRQLAK